MDETAPPDVLLYHDGSVAVVTLNRPARRNGLSLGMCFGLYDALEQVAESDARVLVLRGAGEHFCVGADLADDSSNEQPVRRGADDLKRIYHAATLLHTMPQITIAVIDGGCAGAGMGWAMACDLRFASDRARFATAFLNVGVSGDMGLAWSLTRLVGAARAAELMLMPGKFDATRALEIGLVARVYPAAELHDAVKTIADGLAVREAAQLVALKANLVEAALLPIGAYIEQETARHLTIVEEPGFGERMKAAFKAGRPAG